MDRPDRIPPGEAPREVDFAAAWSPDSATRTFSPGQGGQVASLPFLFGPDQRFGPYRIVRPIGKGGMGQVYEAEETESGRRVAIKILSRGIGDQEERERFLTEGRIAASLSHPNLVYVFGTSEVQGLPVIAMELAPAGTLKDLIAENGPLEPARAVDAILQAIAGLETAAAAGILHRDIKPSNCFVAADGRVLVGDFGLSVATLGRTAEYAAADGMIAGTPGFASPEQLRGERLGVASDIYAVGATLYYLLTGRPPVEHDSISSFVTRTATAVVPTSPAVLRRDVPKKLAAIVTACLAPAPEQRFASYAALARALEPFRSTRRIPAGLGRRFLAGAIDTYVATLSTAPISIKVGGAAITSNEQSLLLLSLPTLFIIVAYCGVLEGFFGAGAGKALLGLRVVQRDGTRAGFLRAVWRAMIFVLPSHLLTQAVNYWVFNGGGAADAAAEGPLASLALVIITCGTLAALFSTARQRNGYAGLHDLASGTRVIMHRRAVEAREDSVSSRAGRPFTAGPSRIGPYVVDPAAAEFPQTVSAPRLIEGYDDRLQRPVWVTVLPSGAPPLSPLRRDLARPARPRWLAGRRTDAECWDAFEAADGRPLVDVARAAQPWSRVRHWLADLTQEVVAGVSDRSLPDLDLNRVWIGTDDRARILDWPAGAIGTIEPRAAQPPDLQACCRFLYEVGTRALGAAAAPGTSRGIGLPLPLTATNLLIALRDGRYITTDALLADLDAALRTPAAVSRMTRAIQVAMSAALPLIVPVIALYALAAIARVTNVDPQVIDLHSSLERIAEADTSPEERAALETYIATHLRATVDDPSTWSRQFPFGHRPDLRARARRIIEAHASVSPQTSAAAEKMAQRYLAGQRKQIDEMRSPEARDKVLLLGATYMLCLTAILALITAIVFRGGLTFRALGTALVRRDGRNISRLRAFARAAIAWSPAIVIVTLPRVSAAFAGPSAERTLLVITAFVMLGCGAWAIVRPSRGIPDRLAGTSLVPR